MSSYINAAVNPRTGDTEAAAYIDDFFGHHNYAVKFQDGGIYPIENVDTLQGKDVELKSNLTWDDFFPKTEQDKTSEVLEERGKRYGNYLEQTKISDLIQGSLKVGLMDKTIATDQKDALMMIAVKLSRIVNGDPDYADNWADIAGYATLVKDRLEGNERA